MAYIYDIANQTYIALGAHHTFGRLQNSVDTHIDKPYISKLHAAIEWDGKQWRLKNLGLNGTWLNNQPLVTNEPALLHVNDKFHLADLNTLGYRVIDLTPPTDMLWPLEISTDLQPKPIYLSRYNPLPNIDTPELAIYFDEQRQEWQLEPLDHAQPNHTLQQGDLVQLGSSHWQFIPVQVLGPTEVHAYQLHLLNDMEFVFHLSLDEESTQLELVHQHHKVDLAVRNHHYLLVQLARHRAADAERGLDSKSQGWIYTEQLANELGLDPTHLNIYIFRLRKQFTDSLPTTLGLQSLLERRGGKIRFGCEKFKIYKGSALTVHSPRPALNA